MQRANVELQLWFPPLARDLEVGLAARPLKQVAMTDTAHPAILTENCDYVVPESPFVWPVGPFQAAPRRFRIRFRKSE